MDKELWLRAKGVFDQAVELDDSRQSNYVRRACGADRPLLVEVEKMLAAHRQANSLLDQPILDWGHMNDHKNETILGEPAGDVPFNRIGNYRLVDKIGEGGMGAVYLAVEEPLGREVAIKLMRPGLGKEFLRRFRDEQKALAALNQRNIVRLYASGEAYDRPYFVMERLKGESLRQGMKRERLPQSLVAEITLQLSSALAAAHGKGIVHRDIKPENIFISEDDDGLRIVALDFGIATLKEDEERTQTAFILGTAAYLSPEQARGMSRAELDGRSDIYSLGLVVYEMLTGVRVFTAQSSAGYQRLHCNEVPPKPSLRDPHAGIAAAVDQVVMKALEKDRVERYQTAREFGQALKEAVDQAFNETTIPAPSPVQSPAPEPAVAKYALPLAAALLLAFGGIGWLVYRGFVEPGGQAPTTVTPPDNRAAPAPSAGGAGAPLTNAAANAANSGGVSGAANPLTSAPPPEVSRPVPQVEIMQKNVGKVAADKVFRTGDRIQMVVSTSSACFFYLVQQGSDKKVDILYPDRDIPGSYNRLNAGQKIAFPPQGFRFDETPGTETLYAVFVTRKGEPALADLEKAVDQRLNNFAPGRERGIIQLLNRLAAGRESSSTVSVQKIELRHQK